jgi:hypothetical protein
MLQVFKTVLPGKDDEIYKQVLVSQDPFQRQMFRLGAVIRLFVVIECGATHAACLPILNYSSELIPPSKFEQSQMALAYTERENTIVERGIMREVTKPDIRIEAKHHSNALFSCSFIHFGQIYFFEVNHSHLNCLTSNSLDF